MIKVNTIDNPRYSDESIAIIKTLVSSIKPDVYILNFWPGSVHFISPTGTTKAQDAEFKRHGIIVVGNYAGHNKFQQRMYIDTEATLPARIWS